MDISIENEGQVKLQRSISPESLTLSPPLSYLSPPQQHAALTTSLRPQAHLSLFAHSRPPLFLCLFLVLPFFLDFSVSFRSPFHSPSPPTRLLLLLLRIFLFFYVQDGTEESVGVLRHSYRDEDGGKDCLRVVYRRHAEGSRELPWPLHRRVWSLGAHREASPLPRHFFLPQFAFSSDTGRRHTEQ